MMRMPAVPNHRHLVLRAALLLGTTLALVAPAHAEPIAPSDDERARSPRRP